MATTIKAKKVEVPVMDYNTGEWIGVTVMTEADRELYARKQHPAYQWPEGLARAGDVLNSGEFAPKIDHDTVIWLDV